MAECTHEGTLGDCLWRWKLNGYYRRCSRCGEYVPCKTVN